MKALTCRWPVIPLLMPALASDASAQLGALHDPPPTGQLIDVGGYRVHLVCAGSARPRDPTVLIVGAGASFEGIIGSGTSFSKSLDQRAPGLTGVRLRSISGCKRSSVDWVVRSLPNKHVLLAGHELPPQEIVLPGSVTVAARPAVEARLLPAPHR